MPPGWLHFPDVRSHDEVAHVAVTIEKTSHGWHVGILQRPDGNQPKVVHLAFHHLLLNEEPTQEQAWVEPTLLDGLAEQVAAMARLIHQENQTGGIPYGFRFSETTFDNKGRVLFGDSEHGLTCSTFVLAVFRRIGADLAILDSWEEREDDAEHHRNLIEVLKQHASPSHVALVEDEIECIRYRPTSGLRSA